MYQIVHNTDKPEWDMLSKTEFNIPSLLNSFIPMYNELLKDKYYSAMCSESMKMTV